MVSNAKSFFVRSNGTHRLTSYTSTAIAITLIASIIISLFIANQPSRAQNYDKNWTTTSDFNTGTNSNINTAGNQAQLTTTTDNFSESFTDTTYKDAATDATWDTAGHKLTLPGDPANGTATNLEEKWKQLYGANDNISSLITDTANNLIYIGGNYGQIGVFNPATSTLIDLTYKITSDWSTNNIWALTYDSTNSKIYLGGATGKFGVLSGGSDPANSTWTYLTGKISGSWSTSDIRSLTFDSTNGFVYLGGGSGTFGSYNGGSNPANGTFVYLNSKITTDWGTNGVYSLTFDSTNGYIYLGGVNAKFGAYSGGTDPANGTWVYLYSKLNAAGWSIYTVSTQTFDSANSVVYLAGETGMVGAYAGGATPANGTFYLLTGKTGSWGLNYFYGMTYDVQNSVVYAVGIGGRFGAFNCNATPSNDTFSLLTAKISGDWSTNNGSSLTYSGSGKVYLGGVLGKFGSYVGGATPANGTWTNLTSNACSFLRAAQDILASAKDAASGLIYFGATGGKFAVLNPANGTLTDLTSKISTDWSTNGVDSLTYDSANGKIYLGGDNGKFGAFTGGADPANGTWAYLTAKISSDWSTNAVLAMTFDSTNGKVYLGGVAAKFGAFTGGADPANGTWAYLTAKLTTWNTSNTIRALTYDSTNSIVYLGGENNRFGAFTGGADPANGTWAYLTTLITADCGSNAIRALTFDSLNSIVYLGGVNSIFGAFAGGSTPASGTWTYLNNKITADWSENIMSLSYGAGKIVLGGASGNFGVYTIGATPSTGTWTPLKSKISSFMLTKGLRSIIYNSSNALIYIGAETGEYFSYQIGYTSNKNGISIKTNTTTQKILKATLTATQTVPANTTATYSLTNDGGATWATITSGSEYIFASVGSDLRWKVNFTTSDLTLTPEVTNISISYSYFSANSGSLNLTYNANQAVTATLLSWTHSLANNTTLLFKIRSAATEGALSSAIWSDTKNAVDTPVDLKTINVGGATGISENQWYEVQIDFTTSDGLGTPILSDITLQYVINQAPQLQNVTASQNTDGSKLVSISFEVKDPDSHSNPYNQDKVAISVQYSNDGSTWHDGITTTGMGLKTVNQDTFTQYSASWDAGTDFANQYIEDTMQIKIIANDNEQAHNTAELASATFSLDTKSPALGSIAGGFDGIKINSGDNWTNNPIVDLTLSAADETTVTMEIRNDTSFNGSTEPYATSKTGWNLVTGDGAKTVYARFYDSYGNFTDASMAILLDTTPPDKPTHFTIYDTSNIELGNYTITSIWDPINNSGDFDKYSLERSTDGETFTEIASFANLAADVYADKELSNLTTYHYRLRAKDIHNNYSAYTDEKELQPAGTDTVPPNITGPGPTVESASTTADIAWTTSEPADSYVEFGTSVSYGYNQGSDDLVTNHSITLIGLQSGTTYHFRVKSRDANGNRVESDDSTFTTSLSNNADDSSLSITGATAQKPGADPEEVTIIWTTDKYATSQVLYGKDESLGQSTLEDPVLNKTHYVTITKLEPNTKYYYKVRSKNSLGDSIDGELRYFVTAQSGLGTPVVNYVEASDITMNSAIISWETSTVTSSVVEIGAGEGYSGRLEDISSNETTKHLVRIKDLNEGTEYHFRVLGQNADGRWVASDNYKFTTISQPKISNISVNNVTSVTAAISWETNVPTDSNIDYGIGNTNLSQGSGALVTNHEVNLLSLTPATKYSFSIRSRDNFGNSIASETQTFQTIVDTTGPVIRDMKSEVSTITDSNGASKAQAIISWSTDEAATSQVRYAMGVAAGSEYPLSTTEDANLTTSHILIISGLQPSATYHLKLISKDASNNITVSDDYTVLTLNQDKSLLQYIVQILEDRFSWLKGFGLF